MLLCTIAEPEMPTLRSIVRRFAPAPLLDVYHAFLRWREIDQWRRLGKPAPPPHSYKSRVLRQYQNRFQLSTLIETGTYQGDMLEACRKVFDALYSVEIDPALHERAVERFKQNPHITILLGDSADVLPGILQDIQRPVLFWLDGHYSGGVTGKGAQETPIAVELGHIRRHGYDDVVLIDDARLFVGAHDYPTIDELRAMVKNNWSGYSLEVEDDIIRIVPAEK